MSEIRCAPLSPHLGAEVVAADVRRLGIDLPPTPIAQALFEHQLLCFRDQHLEPDDLIRFTRVFGEPDPHVLQQFSLPGHPEIFVISNLVENGRALGTREDGFGWHTDLTYLERPAAYTILYGLEVPAAGADTLFASLYKAWDALAEAERARLRPLRGIYSHHKLYARRTQLPTTERRARLPDVVHPMVRIHPHTGREGMYLNRDDCVGIEGHEPDEALALVNRLFDFTIENYAYRHKWRPRDLLIWDNRGAVHTATAYDMERSRRLVYRTSVRGEKPIACSEAAQPAR